MLIATLMFGAVGDELLRMIKDLGRIRSNSRPKLKLKELEKFRDAAAEHFHFSELYLPMLRGMSRLNESETNYFRWKSLKEGSYYLRNAHCFVKLYRDCVPGSIVDKNIQSVDEILVQLEFDPEHISTGYTDEAYDGKVECFVSQGQGTKYYELLHSEHKKDVRTFIEMVELNIDLPLKRFSESIEQALHSPVRNATEGVLEFTKRAIRLVSMIVTGPLTLICQQSPEVVHEEGPNEIRVGILDAQFPRVLLTSEQMLTVQNDILQAILDMEGVGPKPRFTEAELRRGWLEITCSDELTVAWLRSLLLESIHLAGLDLKMVVGDEVPKAVYAFTVLDGSWDEESRFFDFIEKQNSDLNTKHWLVVDCDRQLTIAIFDRASAETLMASSGIISYKFCQMQLFVGSWEDVGGVGEEPALTPEGTKCRYRHHRFR